MTKTNQEVLKKVEAHRAAKKAEYKKTKGQKVRVPYTVTTCKLCRSHIGTFARDERGVLVHVNCAGEKKKPSLRSRIFGGKK